MSVSCLSIIVVALVLGRIESCRLSVASSVVSISTYSLPRVSIASGSPLSPAVGFVVNVFPLVVRACESALDPLVRIRTCFFFVFFVVRSFILGAWFVSTTAPSDKLWCGGHRGYVVSVIDRSNG